jgi:hypothetical protein
VASIEKLGAVCAYKIVSLSDVAGIVTDSPASNPMVRELRDGGASIIQAPLQRLRRAAPSGPFPRVPGRSTHPF